MGFQIVQGFLEDLFLSRPIHRPEPGSPPVPAEDLLGQEIDGGSPDHALFPDLLLKIPVGHQEQGGTVGKGPGLFQEPVPHRFPQLEAVKDVGHGCSFRVKRGAAA